MSQEQVVDPCLIVIFGASGDLTRRKLIPALYDLYRKQMMPERFAVLGVSRSEFTDEAFRHRMDEWSAELEGYDARGFEAFASHLFYHAADSTVQSDFDGLVERMGRLADRFQLGENRLFYLSVAPSLYSRIIFNIHASGLVNEGKKWCSLVPEAMPWQRVIVEKPFGHDLASAAHLNRELGRAFEEESIYRIDHYLGKETVQNIMTVRFANTIFEPLWNRNFVDHVQITAAEQVGVEGRGGYYDTSGALRDMIQSHLLQLMAVVAMEPPNSMQSRDLRSEQRKVLEAVCDVAPDQVPFAAVRAQYASAVLDGVKRSGYLAEDSVDPDSTTETYAAVRLQIDNWRWGGVPFYLRTGKAMARKLTQVVVYFKKPPLRLFNDPGLFAESAPPNRLCINIQPDEGISLRFDGKVQGRNEITSAVMDFDYSDQFGGRIPDAYANLLHDAIRGDQSLYKDRHEIEAGWRIVMPILDYWAGHPTEGIERYAVGSWGPVGAARLFNGQGNWHNPDGHRTR